MKNVSQLNNIPYVDESIVYCTMICKQRDPFKLHSPAWSPFTLLHNLQFKGNLEAKYNKSGFKQKYMNL